MSSPLRRSRRVAGVPAEQERWSRRQRNVEREYGSLPSNSSQGNYSGGTVSTFSWHNAGATLYTAADWLTMGAISDTAETIATARSDQGMTVESALRYGLRMGGRAVLFWSPARFIPTGAWAARAAVGLGVSVLSQAYTSVADRVATHATADHPGTGFDKTARFYYRAIHGEEIKAVPFERVGASTGGSRKHRDGNGHLCLGGRGRYQTCNESADVPTVGAPYSGFIGRGDAQA